MQTFDDAAALIVYVAVPIAVPLLEFVSCWFIDKAPKEFEVAPVTFVGNTLHVNKVPGTLDSGVTSLLAPEQIALLVSEITFATGLTLTVYSLGANEHSPADAFISYVTEAGLTPALFNVWRIAFPFPATAPETPVFDLIVQENVAVATFDVSVTSVWPPEHKSRCVAGEIIKVGKGFTFSLTDLGLPLHELFFGVIEYVANPEMLTFSRVSF